MFPRFTKLGDVYVFRDPLRGDRLIKVPSQLFFMPKVFPYWDRSLIWYHLWGLSLWQAGSKLSSRKRTRILRQVQYTRKNRSLIPTITIISISNLFPFPIPLTIIPKSQTTKKQQLHYQKELPAIKIVIIPAQLQAPTKIIRFVFWIHELRGSQSDSGRVGHRDLGVY